MTLLTHTFLFLQEYFANFKDKIGPVRKAAIAYGPNGVSRGTCNVTFVRPDGAKKAYAQLNGLLIDNRPIVVSTSQTQSQTMRSN